MTQIRGPIRTCFPDALDPVPHPGISWQGHVRLVAATGIEPPPKWLAIKDSLAQLQAAVAETPLTARLVTAVTTGDRSADVAAMLAAAATETAPNRVAPIEAVHAQVGAALQGSYAPAAESNYRLLARRFDAAAKQFTRLARLVDVDANADDAVADRKKLAAWEEAPQRQTRRAVVRGRAAVPAARRAQPARPRPVDVSVAADDRRHTLQHQTGMAGVASAGRGQAEPT